MDALPVANKADNMPHPLENQLVVENLFGYIESTATATDWKSIRAVCKPWYFEALSKWRASTCLNLKFYENGKDQAVTANELLELMEHDNGFSQLSQKPFQNYKLKDSEIDLTNLNTKFWSVVGPHVKQLTLDQVNFKTETGSVAEVMQFLVAKTPNLESLNLNAVLINGKKVEKPPGTVKVVHEKVRSIGLSNFYAFSFLNFPNVQEATLEYCSCNDWVNLVDPTANSLPDAGRVRFLLNSSIKRLIIQNCKMTTTEGTHAHILNLIFTSLEHLYVNKGSQQICDEDFAFLSSVICNHSRNLKSMEYFYSLTKLPLLSNIMHVAMPALTQLRACGNVFANLRFLEYTPQLQHLHLDLYGYEQQEKMRAEIVGAERPEDFWYHSGLDLLGYNMNTPNIPKMQNLTYLQINFEFAINCLKILAVLMPNLKVLKSVFNNDTLPVVCRKWPDIEHLECLFGSRVGNENVTGIRLENRRRKKALVDLSHLTTFKFYSECHTSVLSDQAVYQGFLQMPNLTDLNICVSSEFSQKAELQLKKVIQKVQVNRNYMSNPLHKDWQCCRDMEYRDFIF